MSAIANPDMETHPAKNLNLLSLGQYASTGDNGQIVDENIDAGGPQGISQLMILNAVMESISHDHGDGSGGEVKRPCEVFHAIGGAGAGG
jgi:hypothetical protein